MSSLRSHFNVTTLAISNDNFNNVFCVNISGSVKLIESGFRIVYNIFSWNYNLDRKITFKIYNIEYFITYAWIIEERWLV